MNRPSRPLSLPRRLVEAMAMHDEENQLLLCLWLRGLDLPEIAAEADLPEKAAAERLRESIQRTRQRLVE